MTKKIDSIKDYKRNEKHFNWGIFEYKDAIVVKSDLDNKKYLENKIIIK